MPSDMTKRETALLHLLVENLGGHSVHLVNPADGRRLGYSTGRRSIALRDVLALADTTRPADAPTPSSAAKGGEAKAKAKQALYSLRFEGQPMSSMFSAEELGLIVDTVSAALFTPTEGPASQTEGMGGDAGARRKRASELMAPIMELSEDELILLRYSLPVETLARLRAALSPPETAEAVPVGDAAQEAEAYIQAAIDRAPAPLRRLGEWLANKLDEDDWKTAERMLLGAAASDPAPATDDRERLVEAHVWRTMDSAPLDGKHCILALESGCYILSAQGFYHGGKWITVLEGWAGEPLAWMPNVLLPDELCPERFRRGRAALATEASR